MNDKFKKLNTIFDRVREELAREEAVKPSDLKRFIEDLLKFLIQQKAEIKEMNDTALAEIPKFSEKISKQYISSINKALEEIDSKYAPFSKEINLKLKETRDLLEDLYSIEVKDGYTPIKGVDYFDGQDGKDGSPDTGSDIIKKINNTKGKSGKINKENLDIPQFTREVIREIGGHVGAYETPIKDASTGRLFPKDASGAWLISQSSSSGTVTDFIFTNGNGFTGTVTTSTTTPTLSLTTSLTSGRIPYITTGGALTEDTALRWNSTASAGVTGQLLLGATSANAGGRLYALANETGRTAGSAGVIRSRDTSTYNTTAGALATYAGYFDAQGTKSAGANNLINNALYLQAINGDINNAILVGGGNITFDTASSTARLFFGLAQSTANTAPIKFTGGTSVLATPEAGAIEMTSAGYVSGSHLYWTDSAGNRYQLDQQISGGLVSGSGTTFNVNKYDLGGTLTSASNIDQDGFDVKFFDSNNYVTDFFVISTANGYITIGDSNGDVNGTYINVNDASGLITLASTNTTIFNPTLTLGGTDTTNDMYYRSSSGIAGRIPIGAAGTWLMSNGASTPPSWEILTVPLSSITAPTSSSTSSANGNLSTVFTWASLTTATAFKLTSNGTAAASNTQTVFGVETSGANANATQTTYGAKFSNTHTGTASTNVALYSTASGGTNNYSAIFDTGNVGIGVSGNTPTARLHIGAGTATAGTAPFKLTTGTALATPEDGAMEYHSSHLYFTIGSTRYQLDQQTGGSGITIGTTTITSGTNTRILYNNAGVVGEYTLTGTGTVVAMQASPTFTGEVTIPNTGLHLLDTNATHDLIIAPGSNLTADRTLTVTTGDTDIILDLTAVTDEYVLAYDTATNTWRGVSGGAGGGANTALSNLASVAINTSLISDTTNTDDLGSSSILWRHTYTTDIELGHASDTTLSRVSAGVMAIEGVTVPTISSTNTLTNKRITPRVTTETSSATPTINTDNSDMHRITALAVAITSFTTNLSGTPTDGQKLWIAITDDGTARAITWGTSFEASTVALPTTTVISTRLDIGFVWNTVTSKWRCVAVA